MTELQSAIHEALSGATVIQPRGSEPEKYIVQLPMVFPGGDVVYVYVEDCGPDGLRISDGGSAKFQCYLAGIPDDHFPSAASKAVSVNILLESGEFVSVLKQGQEEWLCNTIIFVAMASLQTVILALDQRHEKGPIPYSAFSTPFEARKAWYARLLEMIPCFQKKGSKA